MYVLDGSICVHLWLWRALNLCFMFLKDACTFNILSQMIEIYPLVRGLRIKANLLKIHKIGPQYLYTQGLNHNLYILYFTTTLPLFLYLSLNDMSFLAGSTEFFKVVYRVEFILLWKKYIKYKFLVCRPFLFKIFNKNIVPRHHYTEEREFLINPPQFYEKENVWFQIWYAKFWTMAHQFTHSTVKNDSLTFERSQCFACNRKKMTVNFWRLPSFRRWTQSSPQSWLNF